MEDSINTARFLTVLRGLLAEPSDRSDDPWQRVIFKPCDPSSGSSGVALALNGVDGKLPDDDLRGQMRAILQRAQARPDTVIVPGGSAYRIERHVGAEGA